MGKGRHQRRGKAVVPPVPGVREAEKVLVGTGSGVGRDGKHGTGHLRELGVRKAAKDGSAARRWNAPRPRDRAVVR